MADAVHYFIPNSPMVARTLRQKLVALRHQYGENLMYGAAEDWADYRHRVGIIRGITDAIAVCEEIEKENEN